MGKPFKVAVITLIIFVLLSFSVGAKEKAVNFFFYGANGKKYQLKEFRGRYVVLNLFASYCPMCMLELNTLEKIHEACGKNLQVISLIIDKQGWPLLPYIIKTHHLTYIVGMAPPVVFKIFPNFSILPTSYILDKSGKVIKKVTGFYPEEEWFRIVKRYVSCN